MQPAALPPRFAALAQQGQLSPGRNLTTSEFARENELLKQENAKLKEQMRELMTSTDTKFQKVVEMIEVYEKKQMRVQQLVGEEKQLEEKSDLQDRFYGLMEQKRQLDAKLSSKDEEISLMNTLLAKKQEDFLFSIEQLKDVKDWSKKTIAEVEQKAEAAIAKRDKRIYECEREIYRKQETVDQVLKLLHREKTKCEKLVLSTNELTRKLEGDLEFKLRILNREVDRVMKIGEDKFRAWPFSRNVKEEVTAAPLSKAEEAAKRKKFNVDGAGGGGDQDGGKDKPAKARPPKDTDRPPSSPEEPNRAAWTQQQQENTILQGGPGVEFHSPNDEEQVRQLVQEEGGAGGGDRKKKKKSPQKTKAGVKEKKEGTKGVGKAPGSKAGSPKGKSAGGKSPDGKSSGGKSPGGKSPGGKSPGGKTGKKGK
eukprot:CAMPEP_0178984146 /NCGR_PEP_ID=MMETSP0795-20121207/1442_1 /TAXON_ID=88552 /ORGANISM="Amoebophrya sp., Strain Ameob2" /LENGTH=423 /DNA_ID=CAMNT_0020674975 /DNA_START=102 /DNA_END=1373 /DNA_ORIENTATION=-